MKISDAAHILSLSGEVTAKDVKTAYQRAAFKYHPDRNPSGHSMMQMVNEAYQVLKDFCGDLTAQGATTEGAGYPAALSDALNAIIGLDGLAIEICGAWVWVDGETYRHRKALKEADFRFAGKKKRWYFRPEDWKSSSKGSFDMDDIRERYGLSLIHI